MKKFICLVVCMLLLSGCAVKGEFNMGINSDKSISFSVTAAYDDELLEALMSMENNSENATYPDEQKWEFLESGAETEDGESPEELGFTVARFDQDGFKGFTYTKSISNIDDLTAESASFDIVQDYLEISESKLFTKDGNSYVSKITYSPITEDSSSSSIEQEIIFTLTLPSEPVSHNADSISEDGKTLTWDLSDRASAGSIEFTFSFASFPIVLVVIGVIALIGIIAALLIIFGKGKKKNNPTSSTPIDNNMGTSIGTLNNEVASNESNVNTSINTETVNPSIEASSNNTEQTTLETFTFDAQVNVEPPSSSETVNMDMNINVPTNNSEVIAEPQVNLDNEVKAETEEVKMFSFETNEPPKPTTELVVDNNPTQSEDVKIFSFDTLSSNQPTENTTNDKNENSNLQ